MTSTRKSDWPRKENPSTRKSIPPSERTHNEHVSAPSESTKTLQLLERAARQLTSERYLLRLYTTGTTPASVRALARVYRVCEEALQGRYELEVIDIYQEPSLAKDEQIIATPTLVKVLPKPLRRIIGDLTRIEKVLFGTDFWEKDL